MSQNNFPLIPHNDYIIVRPVKLQRKTAGGIIKPDKARTPTVFGQVMAVATGETTQGFIPGEIVCFSDYAGIQMELNDVRYLALEPQDILGTCPLPWSGGKGQESDG